MEKLAIVGISSTAEHVYEFVKYYKLYEVTCFVVDKEYKTCDSYMGLPVYDFDELDSHYNHSEIYLFIAMLWNRLNADRRGVYERLKARGYKLANIISPTAKIRSDIKGDNCWIHDYVVIQNNTILGNDQMLMAYTLIGADVVLGNHCFFGAKSTIGGNCVVGEQSFIGINATVFDDTSIGRKCIVGACTAVKRNMPDCSRYVTSSDNIVIKQYSEDEIESKLVFSENKR